MVDALSAAKRPLTPAQIKEACGGAVRSLGVGAAKAAVAPLGLVPLSQDEPFLLFPDQKEQYEAYAVPDEPHCTLLSSLDGLMLLRRDLKAVISQEDWERPVFGEKGARPVGGLSDSPCHVIVDRGRLIGFWEYDPGAAEILWMTFSGAAPAGLREAVARTEAYAREQLGDVRSFSLDSPVSRAIKLGERYLDEDLMVLDLAP